MTECIFCNIAEKKIPSHIVFEDEDAVAFLDVMPRSKGMCIVAPKKHYLLFNEDFDMSSKIFDVALIIGEKINKALEPSTTFFSVMQAQVPHFHIRVYPVYQDQIPLIENKPLETNDAELTELAQKITNVEVDWTGKKTVIEKTIERPKVEINERTEKEFEEIDKKIKAKKEEDKFWRKRQLEMA